jgi:GNAT superfamily N-acetyltransferase
MFSSPLTTADAINFGLLAVGVLTLAVGFYYSHKAQIQSIKTEQATAYLSLEMYSSEVFKYEAEHCALLLPYRSISRPASLPGGVAEANAAGVAVNLYFQTLNLFEVCTRFRKKGVIEAEIFASWVAWFYDTLDDWYFRAQWREGIRENYTPDLQAIFDAGVAIFDRLGDADEPAIDLQRKRAFYEAVGGQLACDEVRGWLGKTRDVPAPADPGRFAISWPSGSEDRAQVAAFLAQTLSEEPAYISHGEIQWGLSSDGRHWARDLAARLSEDLAELDESRSLLAACEEKRIVGAAVIAWSAGARISYGAIEDLAVAAAFRSQGLGAAMVAAIETEARRRGAAWLFLESGLDNHRAHAFFGRQDYKPLSKVFGKDLLAAPGGR